MKDKNWYEKIKFIIFKFGIIKLLVFLFWIQDYAYIRKLIK